MATDIIDVTAFTLDIPVLRNIPVIGAVLNNQTVLTWLTYLIIIILSVVFYKTKYGIYVQVTGENGEAAEAVGVKTNHIKWAALAISAVCCALAGLNLTFEQVGSYSLNMSASRGLICLSAIECGRRLPGRACLFSVLFGFAKALQLVISAYLSPDILLVMDIVPYMAVILVFIFAEIPEAKKNTMRVFKDN